MSDDVKDAIESNATGPKRASNDSGSIEQHPIVDQILADQYLAGKTAATRAHRGLRFTQIEPKGAGQ